MRTNTHMANALPLALATTPEAGRYRWFCTEPCDMDAADWAMTPQASGTPDAGQPDRTGFMAGWIVAR